MQYFKIGNILFNIEYKRIKVLRITVYPPDGRVCIFAPINTADDAIRNFAASKVQWIEKHREKFRRNVKAKNQLKNSEIHFVWGIPHSLQIIEKAGRAKVSPDDGILTLQIPPGTRKAKKQEILDKWYRRLVVQAAPPLVKKWEKALGFGIKKIFYRKMKTHWGSCNSQKKTIRLNTELAKKEPVCLEYVVVHEMLHVIESRHDKNFYRLMDRYIPNWKIIRRNMNH